MADETNKRICENCKFWEEGNGLSFRYGVCRAEHTLVVSLLGEDISDKILKGSGFATVPHDECELFVFKTGKSV